MSTYSKGWIVPRLETIIRTARKEDKNIEAVIAFPRGDREGPCIIAIGREELPKNDPRPAFFFDTILELHMEFGGDSRHPIRLQAEVQSPTVYGTEPDQLEQLLRDVIKLMEQATSSQV